MQCSFASICRKEKKNKNITLHLTLMALNNITKYIRNWNLCPGKLYSIHAKIYSALQLKIKSCRGTRKYVQFSFGRLFPPYDTEFKGFFVFWYHMTSCLPYSFSRRVAFLQENYIYIYIYIYIYATRFYDDLDLGSSKFLATLAPTDTPQQKCGAHSFLASTHPHSQ